MGFTSAGWPQPSLPHAQIYLRSTCVCSPSPEVTGSLPLLWPLCGCQESNSGHDDCTANIVIHRAISLAWELAHFLFPTPLTALVFFWDTVFYSLGWSWYPCVTNFDLELWWPYFYLLRAEIAGIHRYAWKCWDQAQGFVHTGRALCPLSYIPSPSLTNFCSCLMLWWQESVSFNSETWSEKYLEHTCIWPVAWSQSILVSKDKWMGMFPRVFEIWRLLCRLTAVIANEFKIPSYSKSSVSKM